MGGIITDLGSKTTIPRLYAVGENASTGVHGANRLASNSLLECLVFGAQLKGLTPKPLTDVAKPNIASHELETPSDLEASVHWLNQHRKAIGQLVWQSAGISREASQMKAALGQLEQWQIEFASLSLTQTMSVLKEQATHRLPAQLTLETLRLWTETRNLLTVA